MVEQVGAAMDWSGAIGALIGGGIVLAGNWQVHSLQNKKQSRIDEARKTLLKKILTGAQGAGWMTIETLARIVGASLDDTRALLIEIDARGSMGEKEVWSLISRNPLPTKSEEQ
jgi:hypothetical protein